MNKLLSQLGFKTNDTNGVHEARIVRLPNFVFDFSATNPEPKDIIYTALVTAYAQGLRDGEKDLQSNLQRFLGFKVDT